MTLFDQIGATKLRAVVTAFYARVFGDVMIGFMFEGKDRQRLIDKEYELVAALLGAGIKYTGRTMPVAHAAHAIFGGHFERRMQLLRNTFVAEGVPPDVAKAWLDHSESLRGQVTKDRGSECATTAGSEPPAPKPEGTIKLGRR